MKEKDQLLLADLIKFINRSPTAWHAVESSVEVLRERGFIELKETDSWEIQEGQRYFVTRNGSTLCAFVMPLKTPLRARLLAAHTDSPGLKLKPQPEFRIQNMILFGVEVYGGPLLTSWFNRDLGLAGRVVYRNTHGNIDEKLVRMEKYPLTIPQLAIHLDREVNEKGLLLNKQDHLNVLAALNNDEMFPSSESYLELLLREQISFQKILGFDLMVYPIDHARYIGYNKQMIAAYRLDNLGSFHAGLQALIHDVSPLENDIKIFVGWDNEEIGSITAQGASSPFISQVLERISSTSGLGRDDFFRLINRSFCLSVDMAHALHPNYRERHDPQHQPLLGRGVILKSNAQQRYSSDARSAIPVYESIEEMNLPMQNFVSRNDILCGTTIGPIHASLTGMSTIDLGCGELSMHSCREIMASQDHLHLCNLLQHVLNSF